MNIIGIDLGTTNSSLAYSAGEGVESFAIPQLVNAGEVRPEPLLPSSLYLPGPKDFPEGSTVLPWDDAPSFVIGALAQKRGVESAGRLVTSAKSWLCHGGVDRTSALLPLAAPDGVKKISPVEASRQYLMHMRKAFESAYPGEAQVLLTVPASFDAVARELTLEAASQAGLKDVVLLEEPQAAFYAWIEKHPDWRERVQPGDLILIVDIGGGTTDFTLIAVSESGGELKLERVAVGEHILLGGDNIDLALARTIEQELAAKNTKLDSLQLHMMWQKCRAAKEKLLEPGSRAESEPVTILGRGTGLIGGTIKAKLQREMLERILLDGFFPVTQSTDMPQRARRSGLVETGLPYAQDAAITRHMASFLRQQASGAEHGSVRRGKSGLAAPTHVLFNGGVLRSQIARERIMETLNAWLAEESLAPAALLEGEDLMHAVARGAAYYGLARQGKGIRIRGGVARTYYVGIESSMPAVPGFAPPLKAMTVAQFGMEEGTSVDLPGTEFGLVVGEAAEFRFFCSAARKNDAPGTMIEVLGEELAELAPIEVTLDSGGAREVVRVTLQAQVTETGLLQLFCVARDGRRWKLEFNVRERVS